MKYIIAFTLLLFSAHTLAFEVQTTGNVYRVIDGDTLMVTDIPSSAYYKLKNLAPNTKYFNDKYRTIRVRVGNVNTQESKHSDKSRNNKAGELAASYVEKLMDKRDVSLYCWDFGDYHRAICSVSTKQFDLGEVLIKEGYSDYVTYWGKNPILHNRYMKAAQ